MKYFLVVLFLLFIATNAKNLKQYGDPSTNSIPARWVHAGHAVSQTNKYQDLYNKHFLISTNTYTNKTPNHKKKK